MLRNLMSCGGILFAVLGAAAGPRPLSAGPRPEPVPGAIHGVVISSDTGEPVVGASVRIRNLGRNELSHADGSFHFDRLAPGTYTVSAERSGYAPAQQSVRVSDDDTTRIRLELTPSAIEVSGIVVTATGSERSANEVYRPTTVVGGAELRRQLGATVAATLMEEPGISQRYNGPAAAQPVIRGLSGDRVLILEDGQRTGDISTTSGDHAVAIEPLTAERIEVVRGPAGVLYGSNALGGVINVIREEVPRTLPERTRVSVSAQAETVNQGITGGAVVSAPAGPLAFRAELSGRTAGNTRTPEGELPTTQIDGYNGGLGGSWIGERGFAGASVRDHWMRYGVPGTFNGEVIPGGHEGGVEIEQRRTSGRAEAALFSGVGPFESVEFDGSYIRLDQQEFELGGPRGPVVGTRFRQFTRTGEVIARHRHEAEGIRLRGAAGVWALGKNFSTAGLRTGSAPAEQLSVAGFLFEELGLDPFRLEVGARYDWSRISPLEEGMEDIGFVRTRDFGALSGSAAALWEFRPGWTTGLGVSRAFRTPAIEELFSNGPHLADYSFNIGNPDLEPEFGLGTDLFVRTALPRLNAEISVFRNAISDFIYYAPTGELDPRFNEFPVYQAAQDDAVLVGFEGGAQWEVAPRWVVHGRTSYVRASREGDDGDVPLPAIPPLHGGIGVRYEEPRFFVGTEVEASAAQDRVAEFEEETSGHALLNTTAGIRWTGWGRLHTLTLQADNVFDTAWRDHLSRIRVLAPQPGRNLQLLYRVGF